MTYPIKMPDAAKLGCMAEPRYKAVTIDGVKYEGLRETVIRNVTEWKGAKADDIIAQCKEAGVIP